MAAPRKYPDELRERAIRLVLDARAQPGASGKGACRRIGEQLGISAETLRGWVARAEIDQGLRPGTTTDDAESNAVRVAGFVVRELTRVPSNFRSDRDLDSYLKASNVVGIEGIDTRALVRRLRVRGSMNGILSTGDLDDASLVKKAQQFPGMEGRDLVREVVPAKAFHWNAGFGAFADHIMPARPAADSAIQVPLDSTSRPPSI